MARNKRKKRPSPTTGTTSYSITSNKSDLHFEIPVSGWKPTTGFSTGGLMIRCLQQLGISMDLQEPVSTC